VAIQDGRLPRRIAGGDGIDQIGVEEERRALQQWRSHIGLIAGECMHDGRGRFLARREHRGQSLANQWRRIVEQHDHGAFGGGPVAV
jgi:hypothetical protein